MTWVVKKPKRSDFCGCPPCPLCFDWQTEPPAARVQDAWVQEIISGMSKFTEDMLGTKTPTANEIEVLNGAAEAIHVANLGFGERVDAEFKAADKAQHTERQMGDFLAKKREDAARPPVVEAKPCLDDMDLSKLNEPPPSASPVTFTTYMSTTAIDFAKVYESMNREFKPGWIRGAMPDLSFREPPMDDKEKRRIQAEADAKKRMKAQARGYAKVGR